MSVGNALHNHSPAELNAAPPSQFVFFGDAGLLSSLLINQVSQSHTMESWMYR